MYNVQKFEDIYKKFNRREFVPPDPLQFLYDYEEEEERALVAIIASALAYGRVKQILRSVDLVLSELSDNPLEFLMTQEYDDLKNRFKDFKYRFTDGFEIATLLFGVKSTILQFGSIKKTFFAGYSDSDINVIPALTQFASKITRYFPKEKSYLFPSPVNGSACKRPMLFLRWMIRADNVDPGPWNEIPRAKLIVPLDTHMFQFALQSTFTRRRNADLMTAIEVTDAFKKINPSDPVKYDFSLTRFGIRNDMNSMELH